MKKKLVSLFLIAAMAVSTLAGCGSETDTVATPDIIEEDVAKDSVIVAMGHGSEPEAGFDPAYGWGAGEHVHEPLIQSTLTVTTTNLEIAYDLATDVQCDETGLLWTVTIRDDVKFTDGSQLTAKDVAFSYNTAKEFGEGADLTHMEEAKADGDKVVDLYIYYSVDDNTGGSTGDSGSDSGTTDVDLITNDGKGLPTGTNGVYNVNFNDATYVKNVADQGYYLDGCPTTGDVKVLVIPVEFIDKTSDLYKKINAANCC